MQASFNPAAPSVAITSANSGLANDYLNIFNEVVMLIDVLPSMPEAMDDLIAWRAMSYEDYFKNSKLDGHENAIQAYQTMDPGLRKEFEDLMLQLDSSATAAVAALRIHHRRKGDNDPEGMKSLCERNSSVLHELLRMARHLIDHGTTHFNEESQSKADRLMQIRGNIQKHFANQKTL